MKEEELINLCKSENESAYKKLYEIYSQRMMGICIRYIGDEGLARDVLHDGFIKVFASIHSFEYRGEGSLHAWLCKVFTNTALAFLKKNAVWKQLEPLDGYEEEKTAFEPEYYLSVPNEVLMDFIKALPVGYRTVFNLYMFEDITHKEIGKKLNINEVSSRARLSRAKAILVKKIKEYVRKNE